MAVQLDPLFRQGGEPLIRFLDYCVLTMQPAPLFVFLASQYRFQPTIPAAVALYDVFCAQQAPLRLPAGEALPPYNVHLTEHVEHLRSQWHRDLRRHQEELKAGGGDAGEPSGNSDRAECDGEEQQETQGIQESSTPDEAAETEREPEASESRDWWPPVAPRRELFDRVVNRLGDSLAAAANRFDPSRTPMENVPGGKLGQGQLAFIENVWKRSVRPQLVNAGFWRIANVGGN